MSAGSRVEKKNDGRERTRSTLKRICVVAALGVIVVGPVVIAWWQVKSEASPYYTVGEGIPSHVPEERYRVFHPFGFSVIRPRCWDSEVLVTPGEVGQITLTSNRYQWKGRALRSTMVITVTRTGADAPIRTGVPTTFTTKAGVTWSVWKHKHVLQEGRRDVNFELLANIGMKEFSILYIPETISESIPKEIMEYIESVQVEDYCDRKREPKAG